MSSDSTASGGDPRPLWRGKVAPCPQCGNKIPEFALACPFCGSGLKVLRSGYCSQCRAVAGATEAGACTQCGGKLMDVQVQWGPAEAEDVKGQPEAGGPTVEISAAGVAPPTSAGVAAPAAPASTEATPQAEAGGQGSSFKRVMQAPVKILGPLRVPFWGLSGFVLVIIGLAVFGLVYGLPGEDGTGVGASSAQATITTAGSAETVEGGVIKVGVVLPLTGSPEAASAGATTVEDYTRVVDEANGAGGAVLPNFKVRFTVELVIYDDWIEAAKALEEIEKLMLVDEVDLVLLPVATAPIDDVVTLAEAHGYRLLNGSPTALGSQTLSQTVLAFIQSMFSGTP